ncbi:arsenate reductase/protein-tyrosine-phosphatase family protein [Streptomyces beijiangensis]|uniref:Low molecular weight phosphatase family protein n=1 Tax=Streptomyces beijiangensis TaxID=163361 RepID=A0A939F7H3_9ACTN|nr:low molecular weight phosphatase family protein [Streptomyces beijiangensis]MBO0513343.1 low molecular weight phosphatase family protein [Streptomyces beijiangensis]
MAEDRDDARGLTVLFVCTGNMHRSVLAERLLAPRLPGARVSSAGTEAGEVVGMDPATRSVLRQLGGDDREFVSRRLTAALVAGSDLVLGMEREHREAAVRLSPVSMRRCFTLKEYLRLDGDAGRRGTVAPVPAAADGVADPWGQPYDVLHACAEEVDGLTANIAALLTRGNA